MVQADDFFVSNEYGAYYTIRDVEEFKYVRFPTHVPESLQNCRSWSNESRGMTSEIASWYSIFVRGWRDTFAAEEQLEDGTWAYRHWVFGSRTPRTCNIYGLRRRVPKELMWPGQNITITNELNVRYLAPSKSRMTPWRWYELPLSKYISRFYPDTPVSDISDIVEMERLTRHPEFKTIEGEDIVEHYSACEAGSCMAGDDWHCYNCRPSQMYAMNPDKVKLIVLSSSSKFIARRLIFKPDGGDTWKWGGCLYCGGNNYDLIEKCMDDYAKEKWGVRDIVYDGDDILTLHVPRNSCGRRVLCYQDYFETGDVCGDNIVFGDGGNVDVSSTRGYVCVACENCGCPVYDDDDIGEQTGSAYCDDCGTACHYCGEVVPNQDVVWAEDRWEENGYCEDCAAEETMYCDDCGVRHVNRLLEEVDELWFCGDCVEEAKEKLRERKKEAELEAC